MKINNKILIRTVQLASFIVIILVFAFYNNSIKSHPEPLMSDVCLSVADIAYDCYMDGYNNRKIEFDNIPYSDFCRYFHIKGYIDGIGNYDINKDAIKIDVYKKCLIIQRNQINEINQL